MAPLEDTARLRVQLEALCESGEAREIRLAAHVSQEELAEDIGTTGVTISRWETGARKPTGRVAIRYLRALESLRSLVQ